MAVVAGAGGRQGRGVADHDRVPGTGPLIEADWPRHPRVRALSTTRIGGHSSPPWNAFNLGLHVGDAPDRVARNRQDLMRLAGLPGEPQWLQQVHGTEVLRAPAPGTPTADASWTDQPSVVCAIMSADCLPVLLADDQGSCVCAIHAGWRGMAAGVIEAAVGQLPVAPSALSAWLGPAISQRHFEVGAEVRDAFVGLSASLDPAFKPAARADHFLCNLYLAATLLLSELGINRVYGGDRCTFDEASQFFSHRRDGQCGRMANLIWLTDPS